MVPGEVQQGRQGMYARIRLSLAFAFALCALSVPAAHAQAGGGIEVGKLPPPQPPQITAAACFPAASCARNPHRVWKHGMLRITGTSLHAGMWVGFARLPYANLGPRSPRARLQNINGELFVRVPASARSGKIAVRHGRHWIGKYGPILMSSRRLHPPTWLYPPVQGASALAGQGMWIWYVSRSSGGRVASIIAQAHAAHVSTVYIKSGDATNYWTQFNRQLVGELHAGGLHVCAWQFVYGVNPSGEAATGAKAAQEGAECLVIDAEESYEGRFGSAQEYMADLRAKVGPNYPIGLASFPYVYYHPRFPFSVFLAPGAAQFNLPQMYWHTIGVSVDTVFAETFVWNKIYRRPIYPLGQTWENPSGRELERFKQDATLYGAAGWSYWDWQETSAAGWLHLGEPFAPLTGVLPVTSWPTLSTSRFDNPSDQVLWMQEHLATAVPAEVVNGEFESRTRANLILFQSTHGLPQTGVCEEATWKALLALAPHTENWTAKGPKT